MIFTNMKAFWHVGKLSRMSEKFSRFSGEFLVFLENSYNGKFRVCLESFRKILRISANMDAFWIVRKPSEFLKTFRDCLEVYSLSKSFPDYLEVYSLSGNF